jgi:ribonuclease-3
VTETVVIFRTRSDVEASLVRGLLETHGIPVVVSADGIRSIFPAPASDQGDVRISVSVEDAEEATRLIESYAEEASPGPRLVRIRDEFADLQARLGYRFRDRGLLEHALTHRSRAHEDVTGGVVDNESLEFLGDAVLGFIVADALHHEYPQLDEGQKSKMKAALVSTGSLARVAERLDLGTHLILGRGEEKTGGRRKQALLADACEALIAGLYLDGGLETARAFILQEIWSRLGEPEAPGVLTAWTGDYKSALQEALQAAGRGLPDYRIAGEHGPDHRKAFEVDVMVGGDVLATAAGRSKKEAEQEAARLALARVTAKSSET